MREWRIVALVCTSCFARDYAIAQPLPFDVQVAPAIIYLDANIGFETQTVTVTITRDTGFMAPIDLVWSTPAGSPLVVPASALGTTGTTPVIGNVSDPAKNQSQSTWPLTLTATSGQFQVDRAVTVRIGRKLCDLGAGLKQSCAIPDGVTLVTAAVWGGGGGAGGTTTSWGGGHGGLGGFIEGDLVVTAGDVMDVDVGAGGSGGGTISGTFGAGGGGGGYSVVTSGSSTVFAGAGGGGGGTVQGNQENTDGGNGGLGMGAGGNGACSVFLGCAVAGVCGTGGSLTAAGVAASGTCIRSAGSSGSQHAGGTYAGTGGGAGASPGGGDGLGYRNTTADPCYPDSFGAGGGGAGWFGGAGGDSGFRASGTTSCGSIGIGGGGGSGGSSNAIGIKGAARTLTQPSQYYVGTFNPSGGQTSGASGSDGRVIIYVSQ